MNQEHVVKVMSSILAEMAVNVKPDMTREALPEEAQ